MLVYKVFRAEEFAAFKAAGISEGALVDLTDGYIHLSTAEQAPETLERHFAGEGALVMVALDTDRLGPDLVWEPSRGGALFPHLYRPLRADDMIWAAPIPLQGGRHLMPVPPA